MSDQWNQLYLQWLKEWMERYIALNNSNKAASYNRAYKSLEACPKAFQHPDELVELKYFGTAICKQLEHKLKDYCAANGIAVPVLNHGPSGSQDNAEADPVSSQPRPAKKPRKTVKTWVPKYRSGGYAIIMALYLHEGEDGMDKASICRHGVSFCDSSFSAQHSTGTHYSAWNSINTILKHGLAYGSKSRNPIYFLTPEGKAMAKNFLSIEAENEAITGPQSKGDTQKDDNEKSYIDASGSSSGPVKFVYQGPKDDIKLLAGSYKHLAELISRLPTSFNPDVQLPGELKFPLEFIKQHPDFFPGFLGDNLPHMHSSSSSITPVEVPESHGDSYTARRWDTNSFKIKILLDNREIRGKNDRNFFANSLQDYNIDVQVIPLAVGDVIWVAEHKVTGDIAILDFIVERKRLDDLMSSIKDNRFVEQKFRLHRTCLKHIIYLIEEPAGIDRFRMEDAIQTAMSQTVIVDQFYLHRTNGPDETVKYLCKITDKLKDYYHNQPLIVIKPSIMEEQSYGRAITSAQEHFPSFAVDFGAFQTAISKSGIVSVKDTFVRMLMTIRGLSWDKALAIQKIYPTPWYLLEAYRSADEEKRKTLISDALKDNIARKKVGKVLSEKICQIWGGG